MKRAGSWSSKKCRKCKRAFTLVARSNRYCQKCRNQKRKCAHCQKPFVAQYPASTQRFCTQSCNGKWILSQPQFRAALYTPERSKRLSELHKKWWAASPAFRAASSRRMKENNPSRHPIHSKKLRARHAEVMRAPETRKRLSENAKKRGAKFPVRYDVRMGPTKAEAAVLAMSPGEGFWNHKVLTRKKRGSGYPNYYKIDIGFPDIKLAVEADGPSHSRLTAQPKDARKTKFLTALGWKVVRFSNRKILFHTATVKAELQSIISKLKATTPTASTD